jgi:hypothetical protein
VFHYRTGVYENEQWRKVCCPLFVACSYFFSQPQTTNPRLQTALFRSQTFNRVRQRRLQCPVTYRQPGDDDGYQDGQQENARAKRDLKGILLQPFMHEIISDRRGDQEGNQDEQSKFLWKAGKRYCLPMRQVLSGCPFLCCVVPP